MDEGRGVVGLAGQGLSSGEGEEEEQSRVASREK